MVTSLGLTGCAQPHLLTKMDEAAPVRIAAQDFQLANGLRVVMHRDESVPFVHVDLSYGAGAADDPPGKDGLAHLVEHLMFDGSEHLGPNEYFTRMQALGTSDVNAWTDLDGTHYAATVPSSSLPQALWLEGERMMSLLDKVDEKEFAREKGVVTSERHQRLDSSPGGAVAESIMGALFPPEHPYHHGVIGSDRGIAAITLDDATAFARAHYAPNNAVLVLSGSFDPDAVAGLLDRLFGDLPRRELASPPAAAALPLARDRRMTLEADVGTDSMVIAWPLPPAGAPGLPAIRVAASYLQSLPESTRIERRSAWVQEDRLASVLFVDMALSFDAPPERVLERFDQHIELMKSANRELRYREFSLARARTAASVYIALDRLDGRARALESSVRIFGNAAQPERLAPALLAVTAEDAQDAVRQYMRDDRRVVVIVRAKAGARRGGQSKR